MLLSHPDRTLAEHLQRCDAISASLLAQKTVRAEAFYPPEQLERWRKLLVYFHDYGKATDFFQKIIYDAYRRALEAESQADAGAHRLKHQFGDTLADFERQRYPTAAAALEKDEALSHHAKIGAFALAAHLRPAEEIELLILMKIIRRHHGHLTNFLTTGDNQEEYLLAENDSSTRRLQTQLAHHDQVAYAQILAEGQAAVGGADWDRCFRFFGKKMNYEEAQYQLEDADTYRYFFLQHFLFSLLLSADKGDVMLRLQTGVGDLIRPNRRLPADLITSYKRHLWGDVGSPTGLNAEREEAFRAIAKNATRHAAQSVFSITLPTGMGKTLAAYEAALRLQQHVADQTGQVPRLIYCLPFTSIIDQNAGILADILAVSNLSADYLVRHHHLSELPKTYNENALDWDESEYLTAGWEQEIVVTTFVQLLESLFTNRNRALRKFHNMTNAILLLDEVQNIPPTYHRIVREAFQAMASYFGTRFIFITATQPLIFAPDEIVELTDPQRQATRAFFERRERIVLDQAHLRGGPQPLEHWLPLMQADLDAHPDRSFLFITNTIAQSQEIYRALCDQNPDRTCHYLSSSVLPAFRKHIIEQIRRGGGRQLVVSTQVVEAGVDIDLDIVWRDLAPLDSLNQSAGRCNRNALKGQGLVRLFDTGKSFIYDSTLLQITQEVLKGFDEQIPESQFYVLNERYFQLVRARVAAHSEPSLKLAKAMKCLQLEGVAKEFKFISNKLDFLYYNVFIEFTEEDLARAEISLSIPPEEMPSAVKARYFEILFGSQTDSFERKRQFKALQPLMARYTTRLPKQEYQPTDPADKGRVVIFEALWHQVYDLREGFRTHDQQVFIL